ncbi:MAG: DUF3341 domain-containing protein [Bacteroidetes bacterium]|nr:DUF3341 domain-containing protein [Bacteroidota bacterium]
MNITGVYENEHYLMKGIELTRQSKAEVKDVLTPFPISSERTRETGFYDSIPAVGLISGLLGIVTGMLFQIWVSVFAYPMQYGGKPFLSILSYIPVMFELAILFSAIAMATLFFVKLKQRKRLSRAQAEQITVDRFVLKIEWTRGNEGEVVNFVERLKKETSVKDVVIQV